MLERSQLNDRTVQELCDLAAAGLLQMFDSERQLFCHTYVRSRDGMSRQGLSHRYTMMTLLGLHRYEASGRRSPVEIASVLERLLHDTSWLTSAGDLGLLLWTCAELIPDRLAQVYKDIHAEEALKRFHDGQQGCTMEVAWYLTGLATCLLSGHSNLPGQAEQISAARKTLELNCGQSGVYGHLSRSNSVKSYLRRKIGSFADQVYPTIAFARLSQASNDTDARDRALRTATTMCGLQGALGEWSWHYDAATGKVVSRYPVYSVHQHAMAPMMLFAAAEAANCNFNEAIYKGLAWIGGNNELALNFVEPSLNLIWRCAYLELKDTYLDAALRFFKLRSGAADARARVRYECRPYELGWLLYAFAQM